MKTILGFHGRKGHGKTTAARIVESVYGARRLSFADPIRSLVSNAFEIPSSDLHDRGRKEVIDPRYGVTPRWLMQRIGEGVRQTLGPNTWIRALIRRVEVSNWPLFVVDDVRYLNEVAALRNLEEYHPENFAGFVVHVERVDADASDDLHPSETEVDGVRVHDVDGWVRWSAAKPLDTEIRVEVLRLANRYAAVRDAVHMASLRRVTVPSGPTGST